MLERRYPNLKKHRKTKKGKLCPKSTEKYSDMEILSEENLNCKVYLMEYKMLNNVEKENIIMLLKQTFKNRREWFLKKSPAITEIHDKYPRLFDYNGEMISRNIKFCIRRDAWHVTMVRPWIGCLSVVLLTSAIVYLYLMINGMIKVPTAIDSTKYFKISGFKDKTKTKSLPTFESSFNTTYVREKCEPVHVAMVCAGFNSTFSLVTAVKSILFYRTTPLHFHLVVDEISMRSLVMLFQTWDLPNVNVSYYKAEDWIPRVSWIPNKHYSGVYGLLKLILPDICQVPKILVIDTDVTFLNDVVLLWQSFNYFNEDQLLGLVENQSQWYLKTLPYEQRSWPALDKGFNTGIVVMNLKRLRERNFAHLWVTIAKRVLETISETSLADQDIINAVIKEYPYIVYRIECTWNIQLSDHTLSESCYSDANRLNVIHWNSPRKQNVHNKHIDDFRRMHNIFLELDGRLLRRSLFNCYKAEISPVIHGPSRYIYDPSTSCA
ncbi:LARGE xylosyl- and glucuronyltransferase 2-like [Belonocnema kinseyi]|uniref:LARGE xylosyl- and glucuronyltransferase 2-like n=1 Tax=Belonocnema kinseyi TaxID=2817044 RepID=UPI00143D7DA5|nr:LARGE xylosyl- and glucuronyltransferase 2-like [Belonocnema kinseyi]